MTEFPVGSPLPGSLGSRRREVLTVAQLLSRMSRGSATAYTPVAREPGNPGTQIVSVGSLLRREGRAPHAQDRPLQPRAARQAELAGHSGAWPARPASGRRRATAVAGGLVAAASVLGAALYNGAASHSSDAQAAADGLFPGLGLPSGAPAGGLPAGYLPANVSLTSPLPAPAVLAPGTTDWTRFAFGPTGAGAGSATAGAIEAAAPSSIGDAVPAARSAATSPAVSGNAGGSGSGGLLPSVPVLSGGGGGDRTPAPNVLAPVLGGGSGGSGGSGDSGGSGPVRQLTEPLRPAGTAVGGVVRPLSTAAAPVGQTVGGVVAPVTRAAQPLTTTLGTVTTPVADAVEPVTTPVLDGLAPVTGPVLQGTEPLTGPVLDSLGPVTGLLDTSSGKNAKNGAAQPASTTARHALTTDTDPANTVTGLTERLGGTVGSLTGGASGATSSTPRASGRQGTSGQQGTAEQQGAPTTTRDLVGSTLGALPLG